MIRYLYIITFCLFSTFLISAPDTIMPVTWVKELSVEPVEKGLLLTWETGEELNNCCFIAYRRGDDANYEVLDTIPGLGTGAKYEYYDVNPESGNNYYYLKQMDLNGTYVNSRIVHHLLNPPDLIVGYEDNSIIIRTSEPLNKPIYLYSINGKAVLEMSDRLQLSYTINLNNMAKGTYILSIPGTMVSRTINIQ